MNISPSEEILSVWIKELLPKYDVWFFKEKPCFTGNYNLVEIKDYLKNYSQYNNYYFHWNIKHEAKYAIVDTNNEILSLTKEQKQFVYSEQVALNRGLIIENCNDNNFAEMLYNGNLIISNAHYKNLTLLQQKSWLFYMLVNLTIGM